MDKDNSENKISNLTLTPTQEDLQDIVQNHPDANSDPIPDKLVSITKKKQDLDQAVTVATLDSNNRTLNSHDQNSTKDLIKNPKYEHQSYDGPQSKKTNMFKNAALSVRIANTAFKGKKIKKAVAVAEKGAFPLLTSALAIPAYHFHFDHSHQPPAVIFEALKLSITDSVAHNDYEDAKELTHVFRIELEYGPIKWVIFRKLREFYELHANMKKRYYQGRIKEVPKFPNILSYAFQRAFSYNVDDTSQVSLERRKQLESYLISALKLLNMQVMREIFEFLEIGGCSIKKFMGWKGREGFLDLKKSKTKNNGCLPFTFNRWSSSWVLVRDSYLVICKSVYDTKPLDILMYNQFTKLDEIYLKSINPLNEARIALIDHDKRIDLRAESKEKLKQWTSHIKFSLKNSVWTKEHRFGSFAPIRDNINLKWYVDGAGYFYDLSEAILHAKETIYIADWWLSPEMYLRRPPSQYPSFRLDRLLKKKAEQGVDIYVLVYKEIAVSLPNNSQHTKQSLKKLHPRIKVQRHPDHIQANATWFWAHHEKIVVVDSKMAFLGGLDLCYGRFDDNSHRVADYNPLSDGADIIFPGQDYSNARIKDFENVQDYEKTLIDRQSFGRMPWHDVALSMVGASSRDVARHFIERWNFIKSSKAKQRSHIPFLVPQGETSKDYDEDMLKGTCKVQVLRSSSEWSSGVEKENSIYTAYIVSIRSAHHFIYIENQFFVSAAKGDPQYSVKNKIAKAIVRRVIKAHEENTPFKVIVVMPLMPAFQSQVQESGANTLRLVMQWQYNSICQGKESVFGQLKEANIDPNKYVFFHGLRNYDFIPQSHKHHPVEEEGGDGENDKEGGKSPYETIDRFAARSPAEQHRTDYFGLGYEDPNTLESQKTQEPKTPSSPIPKYVTESLKRNTESFKNMMDAIATGSGLASDNDHSSDEEESTGINTKPKHSAMNRILSENGSIKSKTHMKLKLPTYVKKQAELRANNQPTEVVPADGDGAMTLSKASGEGSDSNQNPTNNTTEAVPSDGNHLNLPNDNLLASSKKVPAPISTQNVPLEDPSLAATQYVTELVYIHSKLLIVDDRIVICGSANVNDRSMLGYRDSEIAVIIEDQDMIDSTMADKPFKVSRFAHTFRCTIFNEHLGLLTGTEMVNLINWEAGEELSYTPLSPITSPSIMSLPESDKDNPTQIVADPLSERFDQYWKNVAKYNTKAYRKVFKCVPDDTVRNWDDYKAFIPNSDRVITGHPDLSSVPANQVKKILSNVRGHLVEFPTKFLDQVSLEAGAFSAESIIPIDVFI